MNVLLTMIFSLICGFLLAIFGLIGGYKLGKQNTIITIEKGDTVEIIRRDDVLKYEEDEEAGVNYGE